MAHSPGTRLTLALGLLVTLAGGARAQADVSTSFRELRAADGPRVIHWDAIGHAPDGEFVLVRISGDVREIARFKALPGPHRYQFVDSNPQSDGDFLVYRLEYAARSGNVLLLHETTVASRAMTDAAVAAAALPAPAALVLRLILPAPPGGPVAFAPDAGARNSFPARAPEPPPPRA